MGWTISISNSKIKMGIKPCTGNDGGYPPDFGRKFTFEDPQRPNNFPLYVRPLDERRSKANSQEYFGDTSEGCNIFNSSKCTEKNVLTDVSIIDQNEHKGSCTDSANLRGGGSSNPIYEVSEGGLNEFKEEGGHFIHLSEPNNKSENLLDLGESDSTNVNGECYNRINLSVEDQTIEAENLTTDTSISSSYLSFSILAGQSLVYSFTSAIVVALGFYVCNKVIVPWLEKLFKGTDKKNQSKETPS